MCAGRGSGGELAGYLMGVLPLVAGLFILVAGVEQIEILNSVTQMLHNVAAPSPREASFGAGIIVALFKPDEQPSDWLGRCHRQSKCRCPPSSDKRNIDWHRSWS